MQVRSDDLKDMVVLVVGCGTPGRVLSRKSEICRPKDHGRNGSRFDCRSAPCQHSLIAKHAQSSAGGQMTLEVEHIVDGGVDCEKALCRCR